MEMQREIVDSHTVFSSARNLERLFSWAVGCITHAIGVAKRFCMALWVLFCTWLFCILCTIVAGQRIYSHGSPSNAGGAMLCFKVPA